MSPKVTHEYKEAARERFLDSAEKLFQRKGYYETSIDDVIQATGTSKGAIYGYFESKEALLESVQERQYVKNLGYGKSILSGQGSIASKLEKLADIYFASHDLPARQRCRMNLELSAASLHMKPIQNKLKNQYDQLQTVLAFLLKEGVKNGEIRKEIDTESIASLLMAVVDGLALRWAITDGDLDWKNIKDALLDLTLKGISVDRHRSR